MPLEAREVTTVDYHTAGEPFRIVADPPVPIPGATVAEKRMNAIGSEEIDGLRQLLVFEPRGHADMYGGFITAPDDSGAHFGVLFWHRDGFSTACGHGTIALGAWAIESGLVVPDDSGVTDVVIDVPSGRVRATVHTEAAGRVTSVDFVNVPCRLIAAGIEVAIDRGPVAVDLVWGGAIYACVDADLMDLTVAPENVSEIIALGRRVKAALTQNPLTAHAGDDRLSGVYGTIFVTRPGTLPSGELHQRNITVFADGQVDRSPCGSGTAGRIGALSVSGELAPGQTLVHESVIGTRFRARVLAEADEGVIPIIESTSHKVATCTFTVDPRDDLVPGFILR
ncbi:proline racemase family protein [Brevibacterium marinum]|uniref:Proline racemase/trans-L-3-hydroxyproline dehydratase n=1 Tax=Brevibacterium marinum TaxID=418643 RepID=A0A846RWA0_9MICO|nr:proline racemase family protein [Brevibacterium marinum]NJC55735.1 proline racemase/trans-L-3-hydroxyproline dehydratase [Brevibacterium marinum]